MAQISYPCEFCGRKFRSGRERRGIKLCHNCAGLKRLIRGWVKEGLWVKEAQEPNR